MFLWTFVSCGFQSCDCILCLVIFRKCWMPNVKNHGDYVMLQTALSSREEFYLLWPAARLETLVTSEPYQRRDLNSWSLVSCLLEPSLSTGLLLLGRIPWGPNPKLRGAFLISFLGHGSSGNGLCSTDVCAVLLGNFLEKTVREEGAGSDKRRHWPGKLLQQSPGWSHEGMRSWNVLSSSPHSGERAKALPWINLAMDPYCSSEDLKPWTEQPPQLRVIHRACYQPTFQEAGEQVPWPEVDKLPL